MVMKTWTTGSTFLIIICFVFIVKTGNVAAINDSEGYVVINDEVYHKSTFPDIPDWGRSTQTETKVLTSSGRDMFFEIFSKFETFKSDGAVWVTTENGRRTLSKMKYLILPIWFNDEVQTPADISKITTVMEQTKVYYSEMSWNRHEISWEFLEQVQLADVSRANPSLNAVSDAAQKHILTLGKKYAETHTGIIITYNVAAKGDLSLVGGWGVINGNVTWMSMPPSFSVTRHEIGHNYGHPHHGSNTYNWRIGRKFSTTNNTLDGWDMMSGGNNPSKKAHLTAASKFFFNWITKDSIITMQPEGSSVVCPTCVASVTGLVLKPFDRTDIVPGSANVMAIHIPVIGVTATSSAYSYWLSYRSDYSESRSGLSIHVTRFNLGGQFGAQFDSLNFDAFGNSTTTKDSFVLPNSCYIVQTPGVLMDIDASAAEQIKPVICVNNIDTGNSITVSVSFLSENSVSSKIEVNDVGKRECSVGGSNFGDQTLQMLDNQVHLIEYIGSGIDGNIAFSLCQETGPEVDVRAFFYDSHPVAYLAYDAPPSYGAFMSLKASYSCSNPNTTIYSTEYGQTFVLLIAERTVPNGTFVRFSSTCDVLNCHAGQYLSTSGICTDCPIGSVSVASSIGLESCVSCLDDGLEPVGKKSKDCKVSPFADPSQNTGSLWRIIVPMAHTIEGWYMDVTELEFYSSNDCSNSSRISTTGGIPFDSGNAGVGWGPANAFNASWSWGGRRDSRDLFYLGIDFKREVSVSCIIYKQTRVLVKEIRIQTKSVGQPWKNVWIQRNFQNTTVIPFVFAPTKVPTTSPTISPVSFPIAAPISSPIAFPIAAPLSPPMAFPIAAPISSPIAAPLPPPMASPIAAPIFPTFSPLSTTSSPILTPTSTSEDTCDSPENECEGGLFQLFQSGQMMHRTVQGSCSERCNTFQIFRGFLSIWGWSCGSCP